MSNEKEEDVECSICGVCLEKSFTHQLCCGHTFHYECLMKTFIHTKKYTSNYNNCCPYCNVKCGYLPVVNGLKKVMIGVHAKNILEIDNTIDYQKGCKAILKSGKNKGNSCNKNCQLGYEYCRIHNKI
mgnify:CR=1 FL=1|tara:strand:+ start:582 stop:965 length:384 start_codon:yes stop_codon:yes gene_type:complete